MFGLGRGMYHGNAMPVLCQLAPPRLRSTGFGIFNMVSGIVGIIAAAGFLRSALGLGFAFQFAAFILIASAILLSTVHSRAVEGTPAEDPVK